MPVRVRLRFFAALRRRGSSKQVRYSSSPRLVGTNHHSQSLTRSRPRSGECRQPRVGKSAGCARRPMFYSASSPGVPWRLGYPTVSFCEDRRSCDSTIAGGAFRHGIEWIADKLADRIGAQGSCSARRPPRLRTNDNRCWRNRCARRRVEIRGKRKRFGRRAGADPGAQVPPW